MLKWRQRRKLKHRPTERPIHLCGAARIAGGNSRTEINRTPVGDPRSLPTLTTSRRSCAIFDKLLAVARKNGPVTVLPEKTRIAFQVRMSFAAFVIRRNWVDGYVVLARRLENPRFRRIETFSPRNHLHAFRFSRVDEIDDQVAAWFAEAYRVGEQRHLGSG